MMQTAPRVQRDRRYSSMSWRRARDATLARDAYTCQGCGRQGRQGDRWLVADHKVPPHRYPGAFADRDNLWTLCKACNNSKGDATVEEWQARTTRQVYGPRLVAPRSTPPPVLGSPGRPHTTTAGYEAWAMSLNGVGAEPTDHDHGRWAPVVLLFGKAGVFRICPPGCDRPVRWPAPPPPPLSA